MLFAEVSGKPAGSSTPATSAGGEVRSKCELIKEQQQRQRQPARAISPSRPSSDPFDRQRATAASARAAACPRPRRVRGARSARPQRRGARTRSLGCPSRLARHERRAARPVARVPRWLVVLGRHLEAICGPYICAMTPAEAPVGRLVVCPTPIGNLEDVTLRVLDALREADVIACEDTRHTRVLLARHGSTPPLLSLHEHNERARARASSSRACGAGAAVALVSDAGTPLISDPGFALVRACLAAGLAVEVLPGASAVIDGARRLRRCRPSAGASSAFCRASARELERCSRDAPRRSSRSSPRDGWPPRSSCSPARDPSARSPSAAS